MRCVAIERATSGAVSRRDLRPLDWREIWPELEEIERLRAQVMQLTDRLRRYESDTPTALADPTPTAESEAPQPVQEDA